MCKEELEFQISSFVIITFYKVIVVIVASFTQTQCAGVDALKRSWENEGYCLGPVVFSWV